VAFIGNTTTLTTEGVKTLAELRDTPFKAIINGDIFPCHEGTHYEANRDVYFLKTGIGHNAFLTLDQELLRADSIFQNVQEFRFKDKIQLISNPLTAYEGYENDIEFFKRAYYDSDDNFIIKFTPDDYLPDLQKILLRLGVLSTHSVSTSSIAIPPEYQQTFLDLITGQKVADVHKPKNTIFKKLEYFDTLPTYSCVIEGAHAFDADCLYARDNS